MTHSDPLTEGRPDPSFKANTEACTRHTVDCVDEAAMLALGAKLCQKIRPGSLITLRGELGAGKSFLARAIIHAAGFKGRVKSPTYTLIETYQIPDALTSITTIAHLDLYRLNDPEELHFLGFDDVFLANDLVMIEWPERAADSLPGAQLDIAIDYAVEGGRRVTVSVFGLDEDKHLELT